MGAVRPERPPRRAAARRGRAGRARDRARRRPLLRRRARRRGDLRPRARLPARRRPAPSQRSPSGELVEVDAADDLAVEVRAAPAPPTPPRSARGRPGTRCESTSVPHAGPRRRSRRPARAPSGSWPGGCGRPRSWAAATSARVSRSTSITSWTSTSAPWASRTTLSHGPVSPENTTEPVGRVEAEAERREHRRVLDEDRADLHAVVVLGVDHHRLHRRRGRRPASCRRRRRRGRCRARSRPGARRSRGRGPTRRR